MKSQSPSLRGSGRFTGAAGSAGAEGSGFNPLHCGAVVASRAAQEERIMTEREVSIPFIAGQWSLHARAARLGADLSEFQSPSLRGSGRFRLVVRLRSAPRWRFQSPSLRGSGRFRTTRPSPPFACPCFNPLHCGAVVASQSAPRGLSSEATFQSPSLRGSGRFEGLTLRPCNLAPRLNPLHCGAVVASLP